MTRMLFVAGFAVAAFAAVVFGCTHRATPPNFHKEPVQSSAAQG